MKRGEGDLDLSYREKLLKGEIVLQTREEYIAYKNIPPEIIIKGLEQNAYMMNKLSAALDAENR